MFGALLLKRPLPGICAIDFNSNGISIARLIWDADKPVLELCDFVPLGQEPPLQKVKKLAERHQLGRSICTSLLSTDAYQLLVMEAPPVPSAELRSALRWRVKDFIEEPISEITLDAFDVPPPRGTEQANSVYVVVAKNDALKNHYETLMNADINIQVIDIMEMAQRNIANLLADNENGVALLSLHSNSGMLTLSKAGELYLSRSLKFDLKQGTPTVVKTESQIKDDADLQDLDLDLEMENTAVYDHIALELQRLLDYYESNFRQAPIRKLFLAPTPNALPGFSEYIKDNLNMDVELVDLNNLFECKTMIPLATQAQAFFAIGAALHRIENEPGN